MDTQRLFARLFYAWIFLLTLCQPGLAQNAPELPLRVRETIPLSGVELGSILHPIRCDLKGNLYVRFTSPAGPHLAAPVTKVLADGKVGSVVRVEGAPGFEKGGSFEDFAVDARENVYLVTTKVIEKEGQKEPETEQVILVYNSDGKYDSAIRLGPLFIPLQIAAFPTGELLASGLKVARKEGMLEPTGEAFTAVFDRKGALIAEVSLPGDIQLEQEGGEGALANPEGQASAKMDVGSNSRSTDGRAKLSKVDFQSIMSLGVAVPASDGNIYLMRATHDPIIYVVSRDGTLVRRLEIAAPSEHSRPVAIQVAGGKLALMFAETDAGGKFVRHVFVVANAETGELLARYIGTPETGGAMACYTPDGFTFFASKAGTFVLQRTYPY
ncbi:MAG TPA: hypothetical protein VNN18_09625 [Candidatus Xenobia bacterium]|nr:hypothetical protein [Candidatus Xenobia bacterium]